MCKKLFLLTSFVLVFGLVVNASGQATGQIMQEVWENIGGGTVVSDLTGNANYPDNPTSAALLTRLSVPDLGIDNFGSRIHGYLHPATSGDYTFWIAADDGCALFLSTDDDPANALQICGHSSWTGAEDFDSLPEQMSEPVALEAGGKYYIAALYKEGGGGDNCSAAWQGPDSPDRAVIDGAFLSPAAWATSAMKAKDPDPADGAVDADVVTLGWGSGALAVSHVVYLNGELIAETDQNFAAADLAPGTAYTWKVDEIQEDGTVIEGSVWSLTTLPLEAHFPSPADAAENVGSPVTLTWTTGKNTIINDVYFGADEAAVAARDASTFKGKLMTASYAAGELELFSTYYWAVDEFTPGGTVAGSVWSFSTEKYISLLDGSQTLSYDNTAEPYVSELALDTVGDLTAEGIVSDLTLSFQGMGSNLSIDEATGTYEITGEGADIWGGNDAFHYVYMQLTGDGEISARVVSNGTGTNDWAKGGLMIRESTDPTSAQMLMGMTGGEGGGIAFQGRSETGSGTSTSFHGDVIAEPPYWLKLTREGNAIAAYASADGETWDLFADASPDGAHTNPMDVAFPDTVLIGLFVTSHQDGENRTYTFDNVDIQGDADGVIVSKDIDSASGNTADPIYVALEDATGAVAVVPHPYTSATQVTVNRAWTIPLAAFEGVDPTQAAKLYIGVGDGEAGGAGAITVSDIKVVEGPSAGNIAWVSYHAADDEPHADAAAVGFTLAPDIGYTDLLKANGYNVVRVLTSQTPDVEYLNTMDLVIISRTASSGHYSGSGATAWNSITAPMINLNGYTLRSSRLGFTDGTDMPDTTGDIRLTVTDPTHPIFAGIALTDGVMDNLFAEGAVPLPTDETIISRGISINNNNLDDEGTVLAAIAEVSADTGPVGGIVIAELPAGATMENSSGSPDDVLGGPRLVFLTGSREPDGVTGGQAAALYDLYPDGEQMFLNAVEYYIPAKMWDITAPGDIVKGVPDQPETDWNDIGWPPAENPSMCIDDNTGTKYLHFAGDIQPTGVQITPLDGPSIVTGITLTTANDAPERDPITFELYGSNVSIDGPYELIAAGDVVDFAGEEAWLRYTKNATPIMFDNDKSYAHYQLMFPTVRDPVAQDSMQIAEVELLGVLTILPRTLTISSTGGGFVITPGEGAFTYEDGTEVEVKAVADENFYFLKWTGSAVDAGKVDPGSASITILMDGDYSLKAHFAANLAVSSTNGGSVTTPGEGTFSYEHGSDVPVEATADEYYYFLKWTGSAVDAGKVADPGSASTTVLVDGEYDLKANFAAVSFKLTVSSTDGGSVIKPGEGDIVIGGNYLIPLEVEADQNYKFVNWTGSAVDAGMVVDPDSPITSIFVLGNYNVKAHFAIDTHILTISSTEGGSVTTPGEGAFEYDHGAEVSVVATPDEHYHFVGWTGSAVDAGKVADPGSASTTVTADGDYTLIANFEIDKHTLTISSNNCGSVTTPGEGVFEYDYGTVVDLAATADPDYRFKFWTGPVADLLSASTTVTITEDITVSAVFVKSKPLPPNDS